jgi:hypothetical protein
MLLMFLFGSGLCVKDNSDITQPHPTLYSTTIIKVSCIAVIESIVASSYRETTGTTVTDTIR